MNEGLYTKFNIHSKKTTYIKFEQFVLNSWCGYSVFS